MFDDSSPNLPTASPLWVRVLVRGTGDKPVMGAPVSASGPPVPFAGAKGGPPLGPDEGADVAFLIERT